MDKIHTRRRWGFLAMALALVLAFGAVGTALASATGSSTLTSPADITGSGTASVQLQVSAQSTTTSTPTDVIFIEDQSGSISGAEFAQMASFATSVLSGLSGAGLFTNGGSAGVIAFGSGVTITAHLTSNEAAVSAALQARPQSGTTRMALALNAANNMFQNESPPTHHRVIILMTDGVASDASAVPAAVAGLQSIGVERFAVGIGNGVNVGELNTIASAPTATHVFTSDFNTLQTILNQLVASVTNPGATNITVTAQVASRFGPATNIVADTGTATDAGQAVTWTIAELGTATNPSQTATLTYDIAVSCAQGPGGVLPLHDSISYTDDQGSAISFDLLSVSLHGCAAAIDLQPASQQGPLGTQQTVTATVTDDFGDAVPNADVSFDVTSGPNAGTTATATTDTNGEATFSLTSTTTGTDVITATAGAATSPSASIEWVNLPPVANANGPYTVDEGSSVLLSSAGSSDPEGQALTIAWDLDNNGSYETAGATATFAASDGPATATVGLQVCDPYGACDTTTATVNVLNVAPTPDAGAAQTVYRNDVVTLAGTWTDPAGALDAPYAWSWDLAGAGSDSGSASYGDTVGETVSFATEGTYVLSFTVTDKDGGTNTASVTITVLDHPPVCTAATPSIATLWPNNGKLVPVTVLGITDADGDPIAIQITGVMQDEAVSAPGDHHAAPDAFGVGTDTVQLRAERDGLGNGRVYVVSFTADDGHGGTCSGTVEVSVPHDQSGPAAINDGATFDSTVS